jgi:predicted NBD/HSP70 family sugar kinase
MDPTTLENLIIREIRKAKEISRKDLADRLAIAKSTAGRRIDSMIERGIVTEIGIEDRKQVGRPRRFLALHGRFGGFIGFDFDARNLYMVFVDFAQNLIEQKKVGLSKNPTKGEVISHLRKIIGEIRNNEAGLTVRGIGIGVPGHIQREGRIGLNYTFMEDWRGVNLLEELDLNPDLLHIEHNTRAVALGEYWLGSHAAAKNLVCISVRTGISAAIIANGELVAGTHEMAGEIRGWKVPTGDRETPASDCIEQAGTVRIVTDGAGVTDGSWTDFLNGCRENRPEPLELLSRLAGMHGDAAARLVQLLDPEVVFFAGPFTELDELYLGLVRQATAIALEGHYFAPPPIMAVTLGEYAGAHGAAALAAAESRAL